MSKLRVAVLGCGGRGRGHIGILKGFEDVELVAVCDGQRHELSGAGTSGTREQIGYQDFRSFGNFGSLTLHGLMK